MGRADHDRDLRVGDIPRVASAVEFHHMFTLEQRVAARRGKCAVLLICPRGEGDVPECCLRMLKQPAHGWLRRKAIMGRLDASRMAVLLPGLAERSALRVADDFRRGTPARLNGEPRPELYVLCPHKNQGEACDPLASHHAKQERVEPGGTDQEVGWDPDDPHAGLPPWKRILDVAGASAALLVLSPLFALLALAIKLASPGPAFFVQERIGYRGRRFRCIKFRSMRQDADQDSHRSHYSHLMRSHRPMDKLDQDGDARLIPLGKLLRALALDELPQLVNVVRGEMSLVGPRPAIPYEYEAYEPWQKRRFGAVPGLTGLWQVSGKNRTTFNEMVALDIHYADVRSLWLDLKIIMLTPRVMMEQAQEIMRRTGETDEKATKPRSRWVRVLGTESDS